mgnify:CR=1 FL=1|jgi:Cys-tRNA(Pro)/Cys-tRNA(Cys) deacylase
MEIIQNTTIEYKLLNHVTLGNIRSADDIAAALGYSITRIAKTILLRAVGEDRFFLVVAPMSTKIDLKQLAKLIGARRLQLANKDDLNDQLGYPSHGVSPLGSQGIPVFMDSSLLNHETILVGAGVMGQEIELQPDQLQELTNATLI